MQFALKCYVQRICIIPIKSIIHTSSAQFALLYFCWLHSPRLDRKDQVDVIQNSTITFVPSKLNVNLPIQL
jgi:hypothetical protein